MERGYRFITGKMAFCRQKQAQIVALDPNTRPCPLCGNAPHPGKCPKTPPGQFWCARCLVSHAPPHGPAVPRHFLQGAGVQRTDKHCTRCGIPLCKDHRFGSTAAQHCELDCRDRSPADTERLQAVLETYEPDYLERGPPRCAVCSAPAARNNLCRYHYDLVRRGHTELDYLRRRRSRKGPSRAVMTYVRPEYHPLLAEVADLDNKSMSGWVADLIEAALEKRLGPLRPRVAIWPETQPQRVVWPRRHKS